MSKKKTDKELEQNLDQEAMSYFKHLAEKDDAPGEDDEVDWDKVKSSLNQRAEEKEQRESDLQKSLDEMAEAEYANYLKSLLPTRLQEWRAMISSDVEENWIVHIWNQLINAKLIIKDRTKDTYATNQKGNKVRKQKYRKTNESDKVTSYKQLMRRYNNKRTRQAMELKIRKIAFYALGMSHEKLYNAEDWTSFISTNNVDEHQDLSDLIVEQLDTGFKI